MNAYKYNVPDFDFSTDSATEDTRNISEFLDTDHENDDDVFATPRCFNNIDPGVNYRDVSSPTLSTESLMTLESPNIPLRKSLSVGNLVHDDLVQRLTTLNVAATNGNSTCRNGKNYNDKSESRVKPQNGNVKLRLRSSSMSKNEHVKVRQTRHTSKEDLNTKKFVSMAEAIKQFQQQTPRRFRSRSRLDRELFVGASNAPMHLTVPQSPALQTKKRMRPVSVMSHEEAEMKAYEEAQKFKIKANPLNANILSTPPAILKSKKSATIPEPFNLTEVTKGKSASSSISSPLVEFRANPVPKFIKEPLKPVIKTTLCTNPRTPTFLKRPSTKVCIKEKEPVKPEYKGGPTKVVPFSFDEKIAELKNKKEKMYNEILEKEKKAREFHAQPIPKIIKKMNHGSNLSLNKLHDSDRVMTHQNSTLSDGGFKARPAKVLVQPPFIPKKSNKPLTEIVSYPSNSENRAAEREKFHQHLKAKEETIENAWKEIKAEKLRLENLEVAEIRKQAEYQAQPIRHYKKVKSITPKKITDPVSPKFHYVKNKENISKTGKM